MKKNNKKIRISLIINFIIFLLTTIATIMMFTGFKFMHGPEPILESTKLGMLKYFTVESNIFMGLVALFFVLEEIKILKGKKSEISDKLYILKLMSTTAVGLTFLVVFAYLGPIAENGILSLLMNSSLFFHLIIPVMSMVNFSMFEKTNKLSFKYTFFGLIPSFVYSIFYLTNVLIHIENGMVSTKYDWYWFVQNGVWTAIIVVPSIFAVTYVISLILWRLNHRS